MVRKKELYSSAIRSRVMIREALLELMKQKHIDKISVSEIMNKADLVRRTFYSHYKSKNDVITMYVNELVTDAFKESLESSDECNETEGLEYFRIWDKNKEFVNILNDNDLLSLLNTYDSKVRHIKIRNEILLSNGFSEKAVKYASTLYEGVVWSVLVHWIKTGMEESPEELTRIMTEILSLSRNKSND